MLSKQLSLKFLLSILSIIITLTVFGSSEQHGAHEESEGLDLNKVIFDHIGDNHDWHLFDIDGHAVSMPLPIILIHTNPFKITTFMSSKFNHGHSPATVGDKTYIIHEQKIYVANEHSELNFDEQGHVISEKPLDLSITKNVFTLFLTAIIILLLFLSVAKAYKRRPGMAPKGLQGFMEPLIVFVRDEIAIPNIGEHKYKKFLPYLLTLFFFIWILNLIGLIPFFPGSANVTGNIAVTFTLASMTLLVVNFSANKQYWGHIFNMPGLPKPLLLIMIPIELIGIIIKPFALMIRLFANITAGHIVVLSLVSLIFIFETVWLAFGSVPLVLFIDVLELFVAALQAYIFTMLTALFIGLAVQEHH